MRIFVHNVDTYLGKVLVNELRRAEGGFHRVFGTVAKSADGAPKAIKRISSRDDPKKSNKMIQTIQSCMLVVLDLFNCTMEDLHFVIKALKVDPTTSPPKPTGELENNVTFVLVSSAMVWAQTKVENGDGILREGDYLLRDPGDNAKYQEWKEMEDLVFSCFNREGSTVKGLVVAGGALYGEGEDALFKLFKDAWCGQKNHVILQEGSNRIPTVHVRDLARLVRHVGANEGIKAEETPYFLAVDTPPADAEGRSLPPKQAEIVQGIVDELCDTYAVPSVPSWPEEEDDPAVTFAHETLELDLCMEPSSHMLDAEFAAVSDPPGWHCREGLLKNVRRVADEFAKERKLRAMRVLVGGPPGSGKSTLAANISERFRIPHHEIQDSSGFADMVTTLSTRVCRYRGFVLDVNGMDFPEAERLFRYDVELPSAEGEEEPPPPAEDEEAAEAPAKQYERRLNEDICPSFVIITQAPRGLCEGRWLMKHGKDSGDDFAEEMDKYTETNLKEGVHNLADFFQEIAGRSVFSLPVAGKDEEDLFESARIYMERDGRPFNYLPTGEEVAAQILARIEAKREAEAAAAAERKAKQSAEAVVRDESMLQAQRRKIIEEHLQAHRELHAMPLREYLMEHMILQLTEGLIDVCKVLPDNPADYLANYLELHAADEDHRPPYLK